MSKRSYLTTLLLIVAVINGCDNQVVVSTGLDNISKYLHIFRNKRIGIITNHTAYNAVNEHISNIFLNMKNTKVTALFGPEHGILGKKAAGGSIDNEFDPLNNIPIYSLYGETRKPTQEMLKNIDVLVFDIQEIGARFYTYMSTMSLAMESAAEKNIKFVVLDRPNPISGQIVEGNILEESFATFVGLHPVPVRHGMTAGELANMINGERWLKNKVQADLKIIPMTKWKRTMWYDQTGLTWRSPSPNIPDLNTAIVYPGTCLFEGTNLSEGRGTYQPFLRIGAPWVRIGHLFEINNILDIEGAILRPISFTPKSIPGMSPNSKHLSIEVTGISIKITDRNNFQPYLTGIKLVKYFHLINNKKFEWQARHFDRLCGTSKIRQFISEGKSISEIKFWVDSNLGSFLEIRNKYLIY